jgi:hypothetical protein
MLSFPPAFTLFSCLVYSSTLKMEATCSATSVNFERTARRYIPEDRTLRNYLCEDLKSYIWNCLFLQHAYPVILGLFTLFFQGREPWQLNQCKDWLQTGQLSATPSICLEIFILNLLGQPAVSKWIELQTFRKLSVSIISSGATGIGNSWQFPKNHKSIPSCHSWFFWWLTTLVGHSSFKSNSLRFRYIIIRDRILMQMHIYFLNYGHGLMVHISAYFACFTNKHNIFEDLYLFCIFSF